MQVLCHIWHAKKLKAKGHQSHCLKMWLSIFPSIRHDLLNCFTSHIGRSSFRPLTFELDQLSTVCPRRDQNKTSLFNNNTSPHYLHSSEFIESASASVLKNCIPRQPFLKLFKKLQERVHFKPTIKPVQHITFDKKEV